MPNPVVYAPNTQFVALPKSNPIKKKEAFHPAAQCPFQKHATLLVRLMLCQEVPAFINAEFRLPGPGIFFTSFTLRILSSTLATRLFSSLPNLCCLRSVGRSIQMEDINRNARELGEAVVLQPSPNSQAFHSALLELTIAAAGRKPP